MKARPVEVPREDISPVALAAAADAIGSLPAHSSPEDMARAALGAAWPLVPEGVATKVTAFEIEVVRRLLVDYRRTRPEVAELMACSLDRVGVVCRRGDIRVGGGAGLTGANRWSPTTEGLAELVADARKALNR